MMKYLRMHFEVIAFDLLGQGRSGRPAYEQLHDFSATVAYFTESIHAWAEKVGLAGASGDKYILLGHSMGGLFAGHYALKYPDRISKLVFMSSVGISPTPYFIEPAHILANQPSGLGRFGAKWMVEGWYDASLTPQDIYRIMGGTLGKIALHNGFK